jgi:polyisoprenoid-binding protein YceI
MTAPTIDTIPAGTWNLDPLHSTAGFAVKHQVVNVFRSRFTDVTATAGISVASYRDQDGADRRGG